MSPEDFVSRLEDISKSVHGLYGRLGVLDNAQQEHKQEVNKLRGFVALSSAFKCFFQETVELINTECRPKIQGQMSEFYALFVPRLVHAFQSLCGAEVLATTGYPYLAFTLLRNVYDNTILTSAALQKITDFYSIEGVEPGKPFDPKSVMALRKKTEYETCKKMTGTLSGLAQKIVEQIIKIDTLYDYEVHGGRLTMTQSMGWMKGVEPLSIMPKYTDQQFSMFMNRFCEVGWMVHRLIPTMQPTGILITGDWAEKWKVIDESFYLTVVSLTAQFGKPVGDAVVELVNVKFPLAADSAFPL